MPMDDQQYGEQARKCYLGCVERCVGKCFNALHGMTDEERRNLIETQRLSKRLPGITGNKMVDIDAELKLEKNGLPRVHHDYSPTQIIEYLEKLTKATEGGVRDQLPKNDNPVAVNSAGDADYERGGATGATGATGAADSRDENAGDASSMPEAEVENTINVAQQS